MRRAHRVSCVWHTRRRGGDCCGLAPPPRRCFRCSCSRLPFRTLQEGLSSTSLDITVFWVGLFAPGVLWGVLGFGSLLRLNFEWLLLILTALSLSMANIVGYVRCKQDARSKIAAGLQWATARSGTDSFVGKALQSAAGSAFGFGGSAV